MPILGLTASFPNVHSPITFRIRKTIFSQPPLIALGKEQTRVYCLIERSAKLRESLERRDHGYENIASISIADIF